MPLRLTLLLIGCVALIATNAVSRWVLLQSLEDDSISATKTWETKGLLHQLESDMALLESGQRGYLLTSNQEYLAQYRAAARRVPDELAQLDERLRNEPQQHVKFEIVQQSANQKIAEMNQTVELNEQGRRGEALELLRTHVGRELMASMLVASGELLEHQRSRLVRQNRNVLDQYRMATQLNLLISLINLAALTVLYRSTLTNLRSRHASEAALKESNETLEAKVASRTQQLSHLSRHLLTVSESEKAALAGELHDELGSNLTAVMLDVSAVEKRLDTIDRALADKLKRAIKVLHNTVDIKRRIIHGLRPSMLDSLGIASALRMHCEDFTRRTGLPCAAVTTDDFDDLDPGWNIAFFRIAQEALTNVAKYANATHVDVSLERERQGIRLRIVDDGVGIAADVIDKPLSHGLLGMRERIALLGGLFAIRSGDDGKGTIIDAFVPFPGVTPAP